jgi:hypothetical protein
MRTLALCLAALGVALLLPGTAHAAGDERWALLVGIDDYAGRTHDTVGGVGDAIDFRDALLRAGWRRDHLKVLLDRQAGAKAIADGIRWLGSHASARSFTIFHYSGHVKQLGGDRDHDGEKVDEYLWGADNRFLADGDLARSFKAFPGRLWVDIAGCEAAGFDDGVNSRTRLFTSSSRETEKSYEQPKWRNSVFSGLLVDQVLLHGDGRTSIQRAFAHAQAEAPRITARTSAGPQHPVMNGGDGTEWYLGTPPPPEPKAEPAPCSLLCFS